MKLAESLGDEAMKKNSIKKFLRSKLTSVLLSFILGIGTIQPIEAKQRGCEAAFDSSSPKEDRKDAKSGNGAEAKKLKRNDLIRKVTDYIKANLRIPTIEEFADYLQIETKELKRFLKNSRSVSTVADLVDLGRNAQQTKGTFENLKIKMTKEAARFFKENLRLPTKEELSLQVNVREEDFFGIYGNIDDLYQVLEKYQPKDVQVVRNKVLDKYAKISKELRETPDLVFVADALEITLEQLQRLIGEGKMFRDQKEMDVSAVPELLRA